MAKPNEKTFLKAPARLLRDEDGYSWQVARCPICGEAHSHGGGQSGEDPREYLFHRERHCWVEPTAGREAAAQASGHSLGGYILVDASPDITEKLLLREKEVKA